MKKLYTVLFFITCTMGTTRAQVHWQDYYEHFDTMTVNTPPGNDWICTGDFKVIANHGYNGTHALSVNINNTHTADSALTPLFTMVNPSAWAFDFVYRVCNWAGPLPVAPALAAGDTVSFSVYKYANGNLVSKTLMHKIHAGNYNQPDTSYTMYGEYLTIPVTYTDTFRLAIHIQRGPAGDYWFDIDYFGIFVVVGMPETAANPIHVYPNPAAETITVDGLTPGETCTVYTTQGKMMYTTAQPQLDISALPPGLYILQTQGGLRTRFVKG